MKAIQGCQNFEASLFRFGLQFMSFVPVLVIAGIALLMAVPFDRLRTFLSFGIATISLEVCLSSLRQAYRSVKLHGRHFPGDNNPHRMAEWIQNMEAVILVRRRLWVVTTIEVILWILVAAVELATLSELHLRKDREHWALFFAGILFGNACVQMWMDSRGSGIENCPQVMHDR